MAENKKSFLLYCDLIHTIKKMPNDKAGELLKHILSYVNDENPISDDLIINLTFEPIKQQLKRDLVKYEGIRQRNKENIDKRWNTKNTTGKTGIPNDTKNTDSDTDNDNVKDKVIDIHKFDFKKSLSEYGFKENLISEWLKVRKNKKATNTETAFKKFIIQVELTKKDKNEVLEKCIEKSWSGFNADWILNDTNYKKPVQVYNHDTAGII